MTTYHQWLRAHKQHFLSDDFTLPEIIDLSLASGWSRDEMAKTLRHWPRALHTNSDPDESICRIGKEAADHFEATIQRNNGTCLDDQWTALHDYIEYGKTWEDPS